MAAVFAYILGIILIVAAGVTTGQVFFTHPMNSTVLQGGIAEFRCNLNGIYPCNNIHWVKYIGSGHIKYRITKYLSSCVSLTDRKSFDETRYSVTKQHINEYRLEIRDIRPNDAGAYGCIYTDASANTKKPSAIATLNVLNVWPKPFCSVTPPNPNVGTTVKFSCSTPPGSPTLPLTWTYRKSSGFGGTMLVNPGQSYDIHWRLGTTENYEYFTCFAGYGSSVKGCTVSPLKIPPTPVVSPVIVRKMEGDNAEFKCKVGITTPSIQSRVWFVVDGEQKLRRFSNSSGRYKVLDDNALFRIKQLTERDNNTHVWCTARNDRGVYSEARGTARLLVMPLGSHIIRNPIEDTYEYHPNNDQDKTTSSMDDISASNTTNSPQGHSAAVAGGTAAAIFLVIVVIALWIYLLKGRLRFMKKKIGGRPYSMTDSAPLTVMTSAEKYVESIQMSPYEPPDVLRTSIIPSSATLPRRQRSDLEDIAVYALPMPKGYDTMRTMPSFMSSTHDYNHGRSIHTLPTRNARGRKTHTVCMAYQDNRGSSLPASPIQPRRSRRRETTEDVKIDFRDRQTSFVPANQRSRGRTSCRIPLQTSTMSMHSDHRASSCPNSPRAIRASRRRHTKDEVVLYALPLQKGGTLRMKSSGSIPSITDGESSGEFTYKKRPRFGTSISRPKSKKRSFVSSLSLSELRFSSRRSIKLSTDQKRRKNVEGLVYADLQLNSRKTNDKANIIGNEERTVYADIKGINMQI